MRNLLAALVLSVPLLAKAGLASAASEVAVPEPLRPWVPWVLQDHDDVACPQVQGMRLCAWPGRLSLDLDDAGGRFELSVQADSEIDLPLPGDPTHWPIDVLADGAAALMSRDGDVPTVHLAAGTHVVRGSFRWSRMPESLAVPPQVALLDLAVHGERVGWPRRQDDGHLWLQGGRTDGAKEERLAIEIHRRIDDGVPVVVTTRLRLRVSGKAREIDLGVPLNEGTEAIALSSSLPARLDGQGHLRVQLRPGDQTITLRARSQGPVLALAAPPSDPDWPEEEIWVFSAAPAIRAVRIEGAPGVDPQRTSLDSDWHGLPAYRVARGGGLTFVELRRGDARPPPDSVVASRELWLLDKGRGFVVRDSLQGTMGQGGRVELLAPGELGHVRVGDQDQVINEAGDGAARGVEVRDGALSLVAELTYPSVGRIPAVGWNRDASSLSAQVHMPPGWRLLATGGVDSASGTWIDAWSLLDLFFLLLITLATWKLMSIRWAVLALFVLGVAWHERYCPVGWWLALLAVHALIGALRRSWLTRALVALRWALVLGLSIHLLVFCWGQIETGLFPQLEHGGTGPYSGVYYEDHGGMNFGLGGADMAPPAPEQAAVPGEWAQSAEMDEYGDVSRKVLLAESSYGWEGKDKAGGGILSQQRAARIDPQAIVQTGPGLPRWQWDTCSLTWSGPVAASHEMGLLLLPPWADLVLSLLRVLGLVLLGVRFCDPRRNRGPREPATPAVAGGQSGPPSGDEEATLPLPLPASATLLALGLGTCLGLAPAGLAAQEEEPDLPSPSILEALEARLTAPPPCGDACIEIPAIALSAGAGGLEIVVQAHALATSVLPLPGPDAAWMPTEVAVDGRPVVALRRQDDGFLALRVEEGLHRVVLSGPARDEISLRFPLVPRTLDWRGVGWTIDGHRPDEAPPPSVQLSRSQPMEDSGGGQDAGDLPPWLELRRELDVGIPWLVHNELLRLSPSGPVVHARVPLLPGESVTTAGIPVEDQVAVVTLEGAETSRTWDSTLAEVDELELTAPSDQPWLERWELDCSPIWNCSAAGSAPVRHMFEGRWRPAWQPWPGEKVTLRFAKPVPSSGSTSTIDEATLALSPGRRVLEADLSFSLRSSQGGEQNVAIDEQAQVVSFTIDGLDLPIQKDKGRLTFSAEPGEHGVQLKWRQDQAPGLLMRAPEVTLSSGGANVLMTIDVPDNKWLLWTGGPRWGAVVTLWQYVVLLLLAAWLLGRYAPKGALRTHDWFILGLGMTQVPLGAPIIVVLWLIAVGLRGRNPDMPFWAHDMAQLALVCATALAFAMMYWAVYEGLLFQPDMQVQGAGSWGDKLQWYSDHTSGQLARPWVLWLPLWVWRIAMLLWALWLAVKTFSWLMWAWKQFSAGGLWKMPPKSEESHTEAAEAQREGGWRPVSSRPEGAPSGDEKGVD